jgi:hypothetical protein
LAASWLGSKLSGDKLKNGKLSGDKLSGGKLSCGKLPLYLEILGNGFKFENRRKTFSPECLNLISFLRKVSLAEASAEKTNKKSRKMYVF